MIQTGSPAASAVLFDRDGTLVEDVPYNGDPRLVEPVPAARSALEFVRAHRIHTGVVTNQSGIGRGLLTEHDVRRVHDRIDDLLGPFDVWRFCPHRPDEGCPCRKPAPGMVIDACAALGVRPEQCVVVGDIGADVAAAQAAGAAPVLVPTPVTRRSEIDAAPMVAADLMAAVRAAVAMLHQPST